MMKNNYPFDFAQIVDGLTIEIRVNEGHRQALRLRMIERFENRSGQRWGQPSVKMTVAIVMGLGLVGLGLVVHQQTNRRPVSVVDTSGILIQVEAAAAVDLLDRTWAGGAGQLWVSCAEGDGWMQIWRDDSWQAPFISILADASMVVAMTADGGVLECRTSENRTAVSPTLAKHSPAKEASEN